MTPMKAHQITGTWATLLLPINGDDSIDFARLEDEIDAIVVAGVDGVYSNGTAGEFHTLSEQEFDRASAVLAHKCEKAGLPFQIGVSHMSAQISMDRLRRSKELRPSALQVILPDWFPLTDAEAVSFLRRMAEAAAPIGLVLYNPPHAKRVLTPATITMLAERIPGLVGVKVAAGDARWFEQLGDTVKRISVFTPGHMLASHFRFGAAGSYSNVACLSPAGAGRWFRLMKSDLAMAEAIQRKILGFFQQHITPYISEHGYCNAAADKLLAAIGGWASIPTRLRWPYRWIAKEDAARLRPMAREMIPELFSLK